MIPVQFGGRLAELELLVRFAIGYCRHAAQSALKSASAPLRYGFTISDHEETSVQTLLAHFSQTAT